MFYIRRSSNGRTLGSGPGNWGSNPCLRANRSPFEGLLVCSCVMWRDLLPKQRTKDLNSFFQPFFTPGPILLVRVAKWNFFKLTKRATFHIIIMLRQYHCSKVLLVWQKNIHHRKNTERYGDKLGISQGK